MLTDDVSLPTIFAKKLGEQSDILLEMGPGVDHHEYHERIDMMRAFQQMAISVSFEDAKIAFYSFDLSEEQIARLRIIYSSTNSWIRGHAIGSLMTDLANDKILKGKDRVEAALAILDETAPATQTSDGETPKRKKGMLLKMVG